MTDLSPSDEKALSATADGKPADPIDTDLVRRLADILKDTGLTTIEVERGDLKIRVAREVTVAAAPVTYATALAPAPALAVAAPATEAPSPPLRETAPERSGHTVTSPMVGTIYLQPQPGAAAFFKLGDRVSEGQTLFIVEAMKTMNPIAATHAGIVSEVLIADGQPIEFGEPLAVID